MKHGELERLYSISAQLKKGLENISTGRGDTGKVWVEDAARSLNILLRLVESTNNRGGISAREPAHNSDHHSHSHHRGRGG